MKGQQPYFLNKPVSLWLLPEEKFDQSSEDMNIVHQVKFDQPTLVNIKPEKIKINKEY